MKPGSAISPWTPAAVVGTPSRLALASPSEAGSMPTIAAISSIWDSRITLIMRSVPMLPDPMMATLVFGDVLMPVLSGTKPHRT